MADLKRLQAAVEAGEREVAIEVTQAALDEQVPPSRILDAMTDAMAVIGATAPVGAAPSAG
jgi:methanogenic corrinoid protein MtbC1